MEDNKDNSVKETEQKPQEQTEGKTGGKTMAENRSDDGHPSGGDERPAVGKRLD